MAWVRARLCKLQKKKKKKCTRLAAPSDKVYQLLAHGRWFSSGTPASYTTKTGCSYNKGCTRLAATSDKVNQLLAHGRWFSPGTLSSSTTKTGHHDIAEILLKVALNTIYQIKKGGRVWTAYTYSISVDERRLALFGVVLHDGILLKYTW